ncbi:MAG TPA: hypothetical protein VN317_02775 [Candidatus Methanoperedens sp.]|nr:hypothetical protein [Candidatus Methanoperedens sp.]
MKKAAVVVAALAALFLGPALALAAGIPGATVTLVCTDPVLCADPAVVVPAPATTDAEGVFSFDGLAAAPWQLQVVVVDPVSLATIKGAQVDFGVTADQAPAQLAGRVTTLDGADVSLQVNAAIIAPGANGIVLAPGYPKIQPAWNRNWAHANGKLIVRFAGTGLEGLEKVVLTSAAGSIETTVIVQDPVDGEYHAIFAKRAAFAALVPADAVRGDVIPVTVGLTTATATGTFDAQFRLVGPKKRHPRL